MQWNASKFTRGQSGKKRAQQAGEFRRTVDRRSEKSFGRDSSALCAGKTQMQEIVKRNILC
jgi:hypothetical protein